MAYYRKLPSGKWQATIYLPDGSRVTETAPLKSTVRVWAEEQDRRVRRGEWTDPKLASFTVNSWLDTWAAARVVEAETERGDRAGAARVRAEFGRAPLGAVSRIAVQGWVKRMQAEGVGPHAIRRAYNYLATAYNAAVVEGIVMTTPCRRITLPPTPPPLPPWFTPEEVDRLVAELGEPHATMTLTMCWLGLRWGECAGLRVGDVDWLRRRVQVVGALTQGGKWKEYPKSTRSRRELPAPTWLIERLSVRATADGYLFTTRRQARPLSGSNWRRVWDEAVERAGVPDYTPHACRHTAASWLVQGGASLYDVQMFLGHEDPKTTMRYAHLAPDANGRIETIWAAITHRARTAQEKRS